MSSKQDAKVVILGASGCGKTCLSLRFVKDQFISCAVPRPTALPRPKADWCGPRPRYTASTIGASFLVKELTIGSQKITLQIWDTAGQARPTLPLGLPGSSRG